MSLIDIDALSNIDLVCQYVLMTKNQGCQLAYGDLLLLRQWLKKSPDADTLILILSEELPRYYQKSRSSKKLPNLNGLNAKITRILDHKHFSKN